MSGIDISKYQKSAAVKKSAKSGLDISGWLNKDIKLFKSTLSDQKKEKFYSELETLLSAGLDIKSALDMIEEEQTKKGDKDLMKTLNGNLVKGASLAQAIEHSGKFSAYEYFSMKIGEESGKLQNVLKELASYYAKKVKLKKRLVSALSYPVLVMCTAGFAVFFMMHFIIPMFADVFKRFGGELPALTKAIIGIADFTSAYIGLILLFFLIFAFGAYSAKNQKWFRSGSSRILLATPFLGPIIQKIFLARFCQSMAILSSSKVPLINSLDMVSKMVKFYPIETALIVIKEDIMQGLHLNESMSRFPVFNKRMTSLLKIGEEVNQLDRMFDKIAHQYTDDIENQVELINNLLEPILILFLGLVVGIILVAMYLPMFQLSLNLG